jgi:hypothetical protein
MCQRLKNLVSGGAGPDLIPLSSILSLSGLVSGGEEEVSYCKVGNKYLDNRELFPRGNERGALGGRYVEDRTSKDR